MHIIVVLDRKHSNVSKTVKIMSVSITELIWQAKNRGESTRGIFVVVELTTDYNGWQWEYKRNTSQIAVPRAFTRCQQSLEGVSGLFFEK